MKWNNPLNNIDLNKGKCDVNNDGDCDISGYVVSVKDRRMISIRTRY